MVWSKIYIYIYIYIVSFAFEIKLYQSVYFPFLGVDMNNPCPIVFPVKHFSTYIVYVRLYSYGYRFLWLCKPCWLFRIILFMNLVLLKLFLLWLLTFLSHSISLFFTLLHLNMSILDHQHQRLKYRIFYYFRISNV
jgi:hypothetical protein